MPKHNETPGSSDSELFDDYGADEVLSIINSHTEWRKLITDPRLFDAGVLTEGCAFMWLKEVWKELVLVREELKAKKSETAEKKECKKC